jgi:hypothetical protein
MLVRMLGAALAPGTSRGYCTDQSAASIE